MVFYPPSFLLKLGDVPDSVPLCDFILDERYGRRPIQESLNPYVCGITGRTITAQEQKDRVERLARALAKELCFEVDSGTEYDKVVGIFAMNTIDIMTINWATHRLNGISSPANAMYSADELRHQLVSSGAKCLFTVLPLLDTALKAAKAAGIPRHRIYICDLPGDGEYPKQFKRLADLMRSGESLPPLEPLKWQKGQGARQTAFLCFSSGTSGSPKGVMISHRNVIANTLQITLFDKPMRDKWGGSAYCDVALGLLPQSHIYGLVIISHASSYRGDQVVILPKFDLQQYLNAISTYKINSLYLVPPIVITMVNNKQLLDSYDLSSVRQIFTGAAPLGKETTQKLSEWYPTWPIRQAYGLTETSTVVTDSEAGDLWFGSSGYLLPGFELKLMTPSGEEITEYGVPGEIYVKGPSVVLGYLNNPKATQETFIDFPEGRFLRTGDEAMVMVSPGGNEHIWITDRLKELIKCNGHQVAPAELEACLLSHPAVADCAVIAVPHEKAGEVPKAFVVKSAEFAMKGRENDEVVRADIVSYVKKNKTKYKWLVGGVEFVDAIPKSPSGKILRRFLRDAEAKKRETAANVALSSAPVHARL